MGRLDRVLLIKVDKEKMKTQGHIVTIHLTINDTNRYIFTHITNPYSLFFL